MINARTKRKNCDNKIKIFHEMRGFANQQIYFFVLKYFYSRFCRNKTLLVTLPKTGNLNGKQHFHGFADGLREFASKNVLPQANTVLFRTPNVAYRVCKVKLRTIDKIDAILKIFPMNLFLENQNRTGVKDNLLATEMSFLRPFSSIKTKPADKVTWFVDYVVSMTSWNYARD